MCGVYANAVRAHVGLPIEVPIGVRRDVHRCRLIRRCINFEGQRVCINPVARCDPPITGQAVGPILQLAGQRDVIYGLFFNLPKQGVQAVWT